VTRELVGVLVVNLGTPDAPTTAAVRRYLREFLSDPRVIDIPAIARKLLLELVILPTRPAQSAALYRKVWTNDGSPLLANSRAFARALSRRLGDGFVVALGMRYGRPSLASAIEELLAAGADRIVIFPQYPHATSSSTGSSLEACFDILGSRWDVPSVAVVPAFHDDAGWFGALETVTAPALAAFAPEHVLFSFHGLPERHVRKSDTRGAGCLATSSCCDVVTRANAGCYRAQCFHTARRMAADLSLAPGTWSVGFQSRLGRTPWIQPWSDVIVAELAASGVKRLAVACPGFVADCLETLEEVGIRALADFRSKGGEELLLVPCLNEHPAWVEAAAAMVTRLAAGALDEPSGGAPAPR
jgi:ferrochelatase